VTTALVVTNMYPSPEQPALGTFVADQVRCLRESGVKVELVCVDRAGRGRRAYRELAAAVRRAVAAVAPDLVHVMYGGVMAEIVTRTVRDRPVLVAFCGSDLLGAQATRGLARLSERYGVRASAGAARRAAGITVKSRNLFDALSPGVQGRTWIVPDGVDLARFRPLDRRECRRALGLDADATHVLFPAAPHRPEKRHALAAAAVRRLDGVQLQTLGGVRHDDVPLWINAADAVLLTSLYEGSPNVVKEALACNVPLVSVDVGDVRERIEGLDGCVIAPAEPEPLAAALGQALRHGRTDGRERAQEVSLERINLRLLEIYGEILSRPAARRAGRERRTRAATAPVSPCGASPGASPKRSL
jgi:glycosyltransferase involved in cell wall biosynthesis